MFCYRVTKFYKVGCLMLRYRVAENSSTESYVRCSATGWLRTVLHSQMLDALLHAPSSSTKSDALLQGADDRLYVATVDVPQSPRSQSYNWSFYRPACYISEKKI